VDEDWTITFADTGSEAMTGAGKASRTIHQGEHFMLTYGDGVGNVDVAKLLDFHLSHGKSAL